MPARRRFHFFRAFYHHPVTGSLVSLLFTAQARSAAVSHRKEFAIDEAHTRETTESPRAASSWESIGLTHDQWFGRGIEPECRADIDFFAFTSEAKAHSAYRDEDAAPPDGFRFRARGCESIYMAHDALPRLLGLGSRAMRKEWSARHLARPLPRLLRAQSGRIAYLTGSCSFASLGDFCSDPRGL